MGNTAFIWQRILRVLKCVTGVTGGIFVVAMIFAGCSNQIQEPVIPEADVTAPVFEAENTLPLPTELVPETVEVPSAPEETVSETVPQPMEQTTEPNRDPQETTENLQVFTVTFLDGSGTVLSVQNVAKGTSAVPPGVPHKTGYAFVGWDTDFSDVVSDLTVNGVFRLEAPAFTVDAISAKAGDEKVAVTVKLENNPGIASIGLLVHYDKKLTLSKVEYGSSLSGQFMMPQRLDSPVKLTWISPFENFQDDCVFATLYFTVPRDAVQREYSIYLEYDPEDVYDISENNLEFQVISGGISVNP